MHTKMSLVAA